MDYEKFYQAVVLSYINHDGDPVRFFDEVVAALNQFREENQAAQQSFTADVALPHAEWCGSRNGFHFCDCPAQNPPRHGLTPRAADEATLCEHGKGHCQCDNTRCRNYCD